MSINLFAKHNPEVNCEVSVEGIFQYVVSFYDGHSGSDNGLVIILPSEQGKTIYDFITRNTETTFELNYNHGFDQIEDLVNITIEPNKIEYPDFYVLELKQAQATGETYLESSITHTSNDATIIINNMSKVRK